MAAKQFRDSLKTRTDKGGAVNIVKKEAAFIQPLWWSWAILGFAVAAEIVLALVIVIVDGALEYGVLVFPLITLAGVFSFAVRRDLKAREKQVEALRNSKKQGASGSSSTASPVVSTASKSKSTANALREKCEALASEYSCSACDWRPDVDMLVTKKNPRRSAIASMSGHKKNNHPVPKAL